MRKMKMGLIKKKKKSLDCGRFRVQTELAVKAQLMDKLEKWTHC